MKPMQQSIARIIRGQRGFTMTELLVVIAITSILLGLLFIPITQGFNLTRKAQNQVQVQTQARNGIQQMSREISQASLVLDNSTAALNFPLTFSVNTEMNASGNGQPTTVHTWVNGTNVFPARVLYTKLDLILSGKLPNSGTKDPTTGDVIGGSQLRFPLAMGTRMVRYFIGLKDNTRPYSNIYQSRIHSAATNSINGQTEFPFQGDNNLNPFVLYRAEFDPNDPKLFNAANYGNSLEDQGGFNDPNFFYNFNVASNGATYAANWKAISSAVVDGPNQDVITWVKDDVNDLVLTTPFRPLASFSPSSVVGDTATPAFLSATASESPNAVPTLYEAQQGHWSLPTTLTFYRAASRGVANEDYGVLKITIDIETLPSGMTVPHLHLSPNANENYGTLAATDAQLYCARLSSTGDIFVKTPNLTFLLNTDRGIVKTGIPPIAGDNTGAPLIRLANGTIRSMVDEGYPDANPGELVETVYRINTRHVDAGTGTIPTNQGWSELNLWDGEPGFGPRYFVKDTLPAPISTAAVGTYFSPLAYFGNLSGTGVLNPGGGLMVVPGSERVIGPELSVTVSTAMDQLAALNPATRARAGIGFVPYYRAPGAISAVTKKATQVQDPTNAFLKRWTPISGQRTYTFDQDTRLQPTSLLPTAYLRFDTPNGPGLPAWPLTDPGIVAGIQMERELQVTYLWQNNFARLRDDNAPKRRGQPVDAQGLVIGDKAIIAPEPDVLKVDYSTRDLLNVTLGALVYDTNTRQPTSINLNDKVRVGNTIR